MDDKTESLKDRLKKLITIEKLVSLDYGDEVSLDDTYYLAKHTDHKKYTIFFYPTWTEKFDVLISGNDIGLETLD